MRKSRSLLLPVEGVMFQYFSASCGKFSKVSYFFEENGGNLVLQWLKLFCSNMVRGL